MSQDLILAKKIYTLDKPNEFFTAMIIENGRIVELGSKENFCVPEHSYHAIIDFSKSVIIPGFNDSHIHMLSYGANLERLNFVDSSKEDFITKIRKKVDTTPQGEWVLGRGWDHEIFPNSIYPTKYDLDAISTDHPMLFERICGHICIVNSKALELAQITKDTPDPKGGIIDKDSRTGEITGILREEAIDLVGKMIPKENEEKKVHLLRKAIKKVNSLGITSVQTNDGLEFNVYQKLKENEELTIRVFLTPMITELEELRKLQVKTNMGDDLLRWGRIKVFSDGSLGAETAALLDNYENSTTNKGVLIYQEEELTNLFSNAHKLGWQLETHAIGDRSADMVINAYEKTGVYTNRPVLTHCQILTKEIIDKMASLGIVANIQPIFLNTDLYWAEKKIGKERMKYSYAWKTLVNSNILCAGGSDAPVEKPDPILGIHSAVNRQDITGKPEEGWYPNESLSIWEAIRLFTVNSAFAEFQEHQKGKLLPQYLADFIVLDKDIFLIPPTEIRTIQIISTFMNGKQIYKQK